MELATRPDEPTGKEVIAMSTRHKILIGGMGALTPIVMNLLVVDFRVLLSDLTLGTWLVLLGYIVRVVVLFYLGGLVTFLHKDENSPIKLFELGIVAPALITGFLNASNIPDVPKTGGVTDGKPPSASLFVHPAYAQTTAKEKVRVFSPPQDTKLGEFWRGLTGAREERLWYVIAGSHRKLADAEKQAKQIREKGQGLEADVYAPYGDNPFYAVVIGANLTNDEARRLRQKAVAAGLPKDTYLWTFPK